MTDGTGHSTYGYTADGQLRTTTDGAGNTTGYHYNPDGNPDKITYPNGHDVTMAYNNGQQNTGITDWNGRTTGFGYSPDGNLTTQTDPDGVTATTSYNDDGQITAITDTSAGTTLAGFAYTRASDGEPATATTTGTALTDPARAYTYNSLGQLTGDNTTSYTYDHAGDPVTLGSHITEGFGSADQIVNRVIDGVTNTGYTFNPRGDRTTATTAGVTTSYGYDQANHLTTYTPPAGPATSYAYNGQGLRTAKTTSGTTTSYTWDTATSSLPLMLTAGTTSYIYGPDGLPIETIAADGTPAYLLHDQLGSTRLLTSQSGTVTGTYTYDAWGNTTSHTGTATTPLQYTGQYLDNETGFYYLQHRYYDPLTTQFLTIDPLVAQTRATYTYTGNNPVTSTDPSGLLNLPTGYGGCGQPGNPCPQRGPGSPCYELGQGCHYGNLASDTGQTAAGALNTVYQGIRTAAQLTPGIGLLANLLPKNLPIGNPTSNAYHGGQFLAETVPVVAGAPEMSAAAAEAGSTAATRVAATGNDLLRPGPWAADSVPSSGPGVITQAERDALNPIGDESGCHSCGATSPGTKSGNWVGDHQPVSRMVPPGTPQVLFPQCLACSNEQGLWIINLIRQGLL